VSNYNYLSAHAVRWHETFGLWGIEMQSKNTKKMVQFYLSYSVTSTPATVCVEKLREFLADRTNGRAYATVLRPSVVVVCRLSVTFCIGALYATSSHTHDTGKQINIHSIRNSNIALKCVKS